MLECDEENGCEDCPYYETCTLIVKKIVTKHEKIIAEAKQRTIAREEMLRRIEKIAEDLEIVCDNFIKRVEKTIDELFKKYAVDDNI